MVAPATTDAADLMHNNPIKAANQNGLLMSSSFTELFHEANCCIFVDKMIPDLSLNLYFFNIRRR
jgi:hypothetical protein